MDAKQILTAIAGAWALCYVYQRGKRLCALLQFTEWLRCIEAAIQNGRPKPISDPALLRYQEMRAYTQDIEGPTIFLKYSQGIENEKVVETIRLEVAYCNGITTQGALCYIDGDLKRWMKDGAPINLPPRNVQQVYLSSSILQEVRRITTIPLPKLGQ